MLTAVRTSWALLIGMFLLMLGNGMQGTVLGVRGTLEQFDATTMGFVMSGYFAGFLFGAHLAPRMLQNVGHVRVFAALASLVSAAFILFPAVVDPIAWTLMRVLIGFCFSAVYVVAESWLNESVTNETRGQTLSAYMIVQMTGIIVAQGLLNVADPGGYTLFIIMSVAVSVSVTPMLLSKIYVPPFEATKRMSLKRLFQVSPLGCVAVFLLGGIFSCLFGMSAVYASARGLTSGEISIFVGAIYLGGLVLQFPIGWASDHYDRRVLILGSTAIGCAAAVLAVLVGGTFAALVVTAFLIGGMANPLYSLIIAHANDFLEYEEMAAGSGGLIFLNGVGAVFTPMLVGWLMDTFGIEAYNLFIALCMGATTLYAAYRTTVRPAKSVEETSPYAPYGPVSTLGTAEIAQDWVAEQAEDEEVASEPGPETPAPAGPDDPATPDDRSTKPSPA